MIETIIASVTVERGSFKQKLLWNQLLMPKVMVF
jgi:hypothetical protein